MLKILLFDPQPYDVLTFRQKLILKLNKFPLYSLQQIAGNTPSKYDIRLLREKRGRINFDCEANVIGISCFTPQAPRAYEIADEFRKHGKIVVLGGRHPSALPEEAKHHADSVVIGESEKTWSILLNDIEMGKLKPFYKNSEIVDLKTLNKANRNVQSGIFLIGTIQATRGCPHGCEFCTGTDNFSQIFRKRPIDQVVEELKTIKQKQLWFYDPSLTIDTEYTKNLFKAMSGLNKKFTCFGNASAILRDDELLDLSRKAGCIGWFIGFESISQTTLDKLDKKSNKVSDYHRLVKNIHDHGISVLGNFMFGFDTDEKNVFDDTIQIVFDLGIDYPSFTVVTPYPGTPFFDRLQKENRILTYDWSKYTETGNVVFQPKKMSPKELLDGSNRAIKEVESLWGNIKRIVMGNTLLFRK